MSDQADDPQTPVPMPQFSQDVLNILDHLWSRACDPDGALERDGITKESINASYKALKPVKVAHLDDDTHRRVQAIVGGAISSSESVNLVTDPEKREKKLEQFKQELKECKAELKELFACPTPQTHVHASSIIDAPNTLLRSEKQAILTQTESLLASAQSPQSLRSDQAQNAVNLLKAEIDQSINALLDQFNAHPKITAICDGLRNIAKCAECGDDTNMNICKGQLATVLEPDAAEFKIAAHRYALPDINSSTSDYDKYNMDQLFTALSDVIGPLTSYIGTAYHSLTKSGWPTSYWGLNYLSHLPFDHEQQFNNPNPLKSAVFDRGVHLGGFGRGTNTPGRSQTVQHPILSRNVQVVTPQNAFITIGLLHALKQWKRKHFGNTEGFKEFDDAVDVDLQNQIATLLAATIGSSHNAQLLPSDWNGEGGAVYKFHLLGPAGVGKSELLHVLAAMCTRAKVPFFTISSNPQLEQLSYFPSTPKTNGAAHCITASNSRQSQVPSENSFKLIFERFSERPVVILFDPIEIVNNPQSKHDFTHQGSRDHFLFLPQSMPSPYVLGDNQFKDDSGVSVHMFWPFIPTHDFMKGLFEAIITHRQRTDRTIPSALPQRWKDQLKYAPQLSIPTMRSYSLLLDYPEENFKRLVKSAQFVSRRTGAKIHRYEVLKLFRAALSSTTRDQAIQTFCELYIGASTTNIPQLAYVGDPQSIASSLLNHLLLRYDPTIYFDLTTEAQFFTSATQYSHISLPTPSRSNTGLFLVKTIKQPTPREMGSLTFFLTPSEKPPLDLAPHLQTIRVPQRAATKRNQGKPSTSDVSEPQTAFIKDILENWSNDKFDSNHQYAHLSTPNKVHLLKLPTDYPVLDALALYNTTEKGQKIFFSWGIQISKSPIKEHTISQYDTDYSTRLNKLIPKSSGVHRGVLYLHCSPICGSTTEYAGAQVVHVPNWQSVFLEGKHISHFLPAGFLKSEQDSGGDSDVVVPKKKVSKKRAIQTDSQQDSDVLDSEQDSDGDGDGDGDDEDMLGMSPKKTSTCRAKSTALTSSRTRGGANSVTGYEDEDEEDDEDDDEEEDDDDQEEAILPRRRGRPPSKAKDEVIAPRARGRPPKAQAEEAPKKALPTGGRKRKSIEDPATLRKTTTRQKTAVPTEDENKSVSLRTTRSTAGRK